MVAGSSPAAPTNPRLDRSRNTASKTSGYIPPRWPYLHCSFNGKHFFKWIKQHLRIRAFYGHSENAVKTQIWIAVSSYVLIAILKKRLGLDASLHEILQVLSLNLFERTPILQACGEMASQEKSDLFSTQMNLLDL